MKYKKLGRTNLKVSVIGIGGGAFKGKEKTVEQIKNVIRFGIKNGINLIETAEDYGEEKIAPALKGIREKIILISKSFSPTKKDMQKSLKNSLKKLKTDKIEIYMLHTVNSVEGLNFMIKQGALDALKEAKKKGIIDYIGISGHRIPVLIEAIKTNEFDVVEVPYCIGAYETEKLFEIAKEYEVGIIAIRVFGGGILLNLNKNFKKAKFMNPENALAYVLSNKNVSSALIGVSSVEHLEEDLNTLKKINLPSVNRKKIEKMVENFLGKNFCRGCLACMPCEKYGWGFPIDQLMRMWVFYFKYRLRGVINEYKDFSFKITHCMKCRKCEENCPYKVPIIRRIGELDKALGG